MWKFVLCQSARRVEFLGNIRQSDGIDDSGRVHGKERDIRTQAWKISSHWPQTKNTSLENLVRTIGGICWENEESRMKIVIGKE